MHPVTRVVPSIEVGTTSTGDFVSHDQGVGERLKRIVNLTNPLQSVHRLRERLIQERTAKSNQIRSMFAEEGVIFPIGLPQLGKGIVALANDPDAHITPLLRRLGLMYLEQLKVLQQWLDELVAEIAEIFKSNEACQRLATVPGIGPIIATALVSSVGDPSQFRNGRQFAAWLGLTPMQRSSGGKTKLGGITKRGDTYFRTLRYLSKAN
jgi:transposase